MLQKNSSISVLKRLVRKPATMKNFVRKQFTTNILQESRSASQKRTYALAV